MNWENILIATIPALISGIISYVASVKNNQSEIQKLKELHKSELEKMELKHQQALEVYEKQQVTDIGTNLMNQLFQKAIDNPKDFNKMTSYFQSTDES